MVFKCESSGRYGNIVAALVHRDIILVKMHSSGTSGLILMNFVLFS